MRSKPLADPKNRSIADFRVVQTQWRPRTSGVRKMPGGAGSYDNRTAAVATKAFPRKQPHHTGASLGRWNRTSARAVLKLLSPGRFAAVVRSYKRRVVANLEC